MMNSFTRIFRFIFTKGLLLGSGLVAWALWRNFWEGELWAEIVGIGILICWLLLVWLTTISRYIRLHGALSLRRCLVLGAGMAGIALGFFSGFLLIQPALFPLNRLPLQIFDGFIANNQLYSTVVLVTLVLTILVGALYWHVGRWEGPDHFDFQE